LVNSEDFPEKITLMSSSYSVSYYTSSTAKPEEPNQPTGHLEKSKDLIKNRVAENKKPLSREPSHDQEKKTIFGYHFVYRFMTH
jgi:hypothetical protein